MQDLFLDKWFYALMPFLKSKKTLTDEVSYIKKNAPNFYRRLGRYGKDFPSKISDLVKRMGGWNRLSKFGAKKQINKFTNYTRKEKTAMKKLVGELYHNSLL